MRKTRLRTYRKALRQPKPSRMKLLAVTTACLVIIAGCQQIDTLLGTETPVTAQEQVKLVTTEKLTRQKIGDTPEVAADVMSSVQADIVASTGGIVEQIYKKRGESVSKGDLIVKLSSPALQMQRERAALAVLSAKDALDQAKRADAEARSEQAAGVLKQETELDRLTKQYNRTRNSYDAGIATKAQLEQAKAELQAHQLEMEIAKKKQQASGESKSLTSLEVQLRNAELTLQQAEEAIGALEVRAAISGVLAELDLEAGMQLQPEVKIGHILLLDRLKIKASLNEAAAKQVAGKTELSYYVAGETAPYKGRVSYLASFFNPQTKGYELNVEVDNASGHLKPGMKVRLQLASEADQMVLTVPTYSVIKEGDQFYVFVLNGGVAEKRKVTLGRINEPNQEVLSGVRENELLITTGHSQLTDREKVRTAEPEATKQGEKQ
ncbi:efflux RND transporter periplasmic adaptor subunit [Paenibacillus silviterrae]|uniref:efflux RND transporter periplasmic adaptor subunit n=1 Tax=Paenibacillus silviterrae TaxID=3242194 RepID=UPI002543F33C|nr:efflux RND transporter periplasmic adaptor subunit [Paenibacillus chinjuensis]